MLTRFTNSDDNKAALVSTVPLKRLATPEEIAHVIAFVASADRTARFVGADLADATSIARFAKEVGDIDILVNNAGFSVWGPTETFEIASFDAMFAANVRAPFFLVSAFAPGMVSRGTGSIINISSMAGRLGLTGGAAYGATKAALASFTQA